jgi:hypothetical protein
MRTVGRMIVGAQGVITTQFQSTVTGPRGTIAGPLRSRTHTIGKPGKSGRGDDEVWVFSNESLQRLRVHQQGGAGGQMVTLAFSRGPDGLQCKFSRPWAHETGVRDIRVTSVIDDRPIQILEDKLVSSSCQICLSADARPDGTCSPKADSPDEPAKVAVQSKPEKPAAAGFDGTWTITRSGPTCPTRNYVFLLAIEKTVASGYAGGGAIRGAVSADGAINFSHPASQTGPAGRKNTVSYSGVLQIDSGHGTFKGGGRCGGTFVAKRS